MNSISKVLLILGISISLGQISFGHGGEDHSKDAAQNEMDPQPDLSLVYNDINSQYIKNVKPLFEKACFDCHSNSTKFPWYYSIPGIKTMIDNDIFEAKKHLDFSDNFPFKSHESPKKDLKSIKEAILEKEMPPLEYKILHSKSRLSGKSQKKIIQWVDSSLKKINERSK